MIMYGIVLFWARQGVRNPDLKEHFKVEYTNADKIQYIGHFSVKYLLLEVNIVKG